ncbi:Asp-tRNA(Asn)/Glu-tRNA(Gln) amidotransferase subunit GatB [Chlamydiales bacterium]|nr:Asp-tRNA(Asn)/Glu-tRNA(Gln) amidotransferase subunit GatB [Chlamydiales bacterium]
MNPKYEAVIGLEIHVELNTKSKLFSPAPNRFGDEPNTNISYVCTGLPGTLPVLNKEAVRKAIQFGCAIGAEVQSFSTFDRKSYFYPDSPRNFQITQFENPIIKGGSVVGEVDGKEITFGITSAHIEDDTGMLKHFNAFAGIDFNRAGVPLIEIVSEPCMHSPKEAVAYATSIKAILQYIDASDCNMEEGSLRFDANISVRLKGEKTFRNKVEIKNMNSFSNMELALTSEIHRQIEEYENNPDTPIDQIIKQTTIRWDPELQKTILMRRKEKAEDYRFFPEPDLPPIILTESYIEKIRQELPELPLEREKRYVKELGLSEHHAFVLIADKPTSDYFEETLLYSKNAKLLCNWIIIEFQGRYNETGKTLVTSGIPPRHVANLVNLIESNKITGRIAKSVADDMFNNTTLDPIDIVKNNPDYNPVHDVTQIEPIVDAVLKENEQSIIDFLSGRDKAFAYLVGQVMKMTRGKASPQVVNELLKAKILKRDEKN